MISGQKADLMVNTPPQSSPAPGSTWPWSKVVLVVSLGLNLMFAGLIGGALLHGGPPDRQVKLRDLNFGPLAEALSPQDRQALRREFLKAVPDMQEQRNAMQQDVAAILAALRAPTFDRAVLEGLFVRQADRASRRQTLGQGLMLDLVAQMSPESRKGFADRLESAIKNRPKSAGN
jgi:uncharacterized membrane protein